MADKLVRMISEAEARASKLEPPETKGRTLILHCNTGLGPAYIYYWTLRLGGVEGIEIQDCVTGMSNLLPYTDYDSVIIWSNHPSDPTLVAAYQNSTLMGYDTRIITPPLPPALEEYFDPGDLTLVEGGSPYFTMSIAGLEWAIRRVGKKGLRFERLTSIGEEGFSETVEGLVEEYSSELELLVSFKGDPGVTVIHTPMQVPAVIHHYLLDPSIRVYPGWAIREGFRVSPYTVFYGTSVEESYYKDLWFRLRDSRLVKIMLNVDPVTAPVYTMMLQGAVYGRIV